MAFTRARSNLIVWCKTGQRSTVSELLESVIPEIKDEEVKLTVSTVQPEDDNEDSEWPEYTQYEYGELCPSTLKKQDTSGNRLTAEPDSYPIHVESLETVVEFKQSNRSADFINGDEEDNKNYIRQGQLLHTVFASIKTADDLPAVMEELTGEGVIESAEQEKRIRDLAEKALKNPQVQKWYDGTNQLYNECAIIYTDENGNLQTRRPDRVMIKDGKVTIVDFKFGKKKDDYREQVKEYMALLSKMGYQQTEGYLWYVYTDELEQVN